MPTSFLRFRRAAWCVIGLLTLTVHAQNDAASRRAAIEGMYPVMMNALETKNFGRARNICDQAILWEPQNPVHHYNLACIEAQAGGSRLAQAWGALELSLALGFDDANHLKTDPDLLPLHGDPRFADMVRKAMLNASGGSALASLALPATAARAPTTPNPAVETERPIAPTFQNDVPVGLYFMTRYWSANQPLERSVWYFAPDGTVCANLENGFSAKDLASHQGPRGKARRAEHAFEIEWSDGKQSKDQLERDGAGFTWDMGIFAPIVAFENDSELAGVYECVESISPGSAPVALRLTLRADGTFTWEGASFAAGKSGVISLKSGHNETTAGRWELNGFSLTLTQANGASLRRFVFPNDDDKTVIKPDWMFFGGLMYKRRP